MEGIEKIFFTDGFIISVGGVLFGALLFLLKWIVNRFIKTYDKDQENNAKDHEKFEDRLDNNDKQIASLEGKLGG